MPVYFVSHGGGPWPFVDGMRQMHAKTEIGLRALAGRLPETPKAILVITGHWEAQAFTVSTAEHPPMLYDYRGFPEHTYRIQYPAPGSPALAARVKSLLVEAKLPVQEDARRGFDHGTFIPLMMMYPDADVPVVMLSIRSGYDAAEHIRLGQALTPLRDEGVLILGSGMTYHNMQGFGRAESADVASSFQSYLDAALSQSDWRARNERLAHWDQAAGARLAHPHEDHLIPLMVAAGAAAQDSGKAFIADQLFKVSVASYEFGGNQRQS